MNAGTPASLQATLQSAAQRHTEPVLAAVERMRVMLAAANNLLVNGYTILFLAADAQSVKPVIFVANDARLHDLAAGDKALYYHSGSDIEGHYRIGQFEHLGTIVKWIERGN